MEWMEILKLAAGFLTMAATFFGGFYAAKNGTPVPAPPVPVPDTLEVVALKAEIAALKAALTAALAPK